MDNNITLVYQGKPIDIAITPTESADETEYKMYHSLVVANDPARVGIIDTNKIYGMQYSQRVGHSPDLSKTMIVRSVIEERTFRPSLIKYIQKYVDAQEADIFREIGTNNTDLVVATNLARLPKKRVDRGSSRIHLVANLLSRIAHAPITDYLDYGTGDGTIAMSIASALGLENNRVQGVDVFAMNRPIPSLVITQGQRLPQEWTNRFQLITLFSVLHHVKDQESVIEDLYRVLAPGGILIMREHDFRDTRSPSLLKTLTHTQVIRGVVNGPFYHFLDAIHVTSMAIAGEELSHSEGKDFYSHYRPRYEWDDMLMNVGFQHICTSLHGMDQMDTGLLQPLPTENTWIDLNPQRLYEAVYRKEPLSDTRMIIEYRTTRDTNVGAFFPRIGGREGSIPPVQSGVNYDEEILAYMTPWFDAQETSRLISRLIREKYEQSDTGRGRRVRPFPLYDGTGGAGGNLIAYLGNRDISVINVYERVPHFYRYLVNNAQLYTGVSSTQTQDGDMLVHTLSGPGNLPPVQQYVYMHNTEFPLNALLTPTPSRGRQQSTTPFSGSVLFLDVPWIHEGCGYKLSGYTYAGMSLEQLTRSVLNAGALMVLLKLPPNYNLGVRHEKHELGKETLYAIFPWNVRERQRQQVSQPAPPQTPQLQRVVSAPRPQPAPVARPSIYVPTEYTEIVRLINERFPQLRQQAEETLPFDPDAIEALRQAIIRVAQQYISVTDISV